MAPPGPARLIIGSLTHGSSGTVTASLLLCSSPNLNWAQEIASGVSGVSVCQALGKHRHLSTFPLVVGRHFLT